MVNPLSPSRVNLNNDMDQEAGKTRKKIVRKAEKYNLDLKKQPPVMFASKKWSWRTARTIDAGTIVLVSNYTIDYDKGLWCTTQNTFERISKRDSANDKSLSPVVARNCTRKQSNLHWIATLLWWKGGEKNATQVNY